MYYIYICRYAMMKSEKKGRHLRMVTGGGT